MRRPIKNYEGLYEIDSDGNIWSYRKRKNTWIKKRPHVRQSGYAVSTLHNSRYAKAKVKCVYVHRIVAEAFLINPQNKKTVNHINGIKSDNRVCNLEWATYSENHLHSFAKLGRVGSATGKFGFAHHRSRPVFCFRDGSMIHYGSTRIAAQQTGFNQSSISLAARTGREYKNAKWRYGILE